MLRLDPLSNYFWTDTKPLRFAFDVILVVLLHSCPRHLAQTNCTEMPNGINRDRYIIYLGWEFVAFWFFFHIALQRCAYRKHNSIHASPNSYIRCFPVILKSRPSKNRRLIDTLHQVNILRVYENISTKNIRRSVNKAVFNLLYRIDIGHCI